MEEGWYWVRWDKNVRDLGGTLEVLHYNPMPSVWKANGTAVPQDPRLFAIVEPVNKPKEA